MNRRHLLFFLLALVAGCADVEVNSGLREELLEMGRRDQEVRARMRPLLLSTDMTAPPTEAFIAMVDEQNAIDQENARRIEEIVSEFGWPGPALVGAEASAAAQTILQHAELEPLKRLLPFFRTAVSQGQADAGQLAMVEDQIRVEEGRNQIYGTEVTTGPDGITSLYPLEDPDSVDERRRTVGLPPLEEYLDRMEKIIGRPIQR